MTRPARGHFPEFDLLRGGAIVAVVYLHAYFTPWPEVSSEGLTLLRVAHLFAHGAVPLFLFISAFLQASSGPETVARHLRRRWWSTWLPALIWMAAALAYRLAGEGPSWALARDLALFDISGQFYFVWLLLVFGVALTQAARIPEAWWPAVLSVALALNLATIAGYELHGGLSGLTATIAYRDPLAWVFFPVFGYWLGSRGRDALSRPAVVVSAAVMAGAAAAYLLQGLRFGAWPVSYFGLSVFAFSAGGMVVYTAAARALANVAAPAPLVALSRYSYPIFLVHLPFVMGLGTHQILGDGAAWSNYWVLLHANVVVGLVLSLAFVREVEKASPWLGHRVLGLRRKRLPTGTPSAEPHPPGAVTAPFR